MPVDQLERAASALARSRYGYLGLRPLGTVPSEAPVVIIPRRDILGLYRAVERAEELYPKASAWEVVGADARHDPPPAPGGHSRSPSLRPGEFCLKTPTIIATCGAGT